MARPCAEMPAVRRQLDLILVDVSTYVETAGLEVWHPGLGWDQILGFVEDLDTTNTVILRLKLTKHTSQWSSHTRVLQNAAHLLLEGLSWRRGAEFSDGGRKEQAAVQRQLPTLSALAASVPRRDIRGQELVLEKPKKLRLQVNHAHVMVITVCTCQPCPPLYLLRAHGRRSTYHSFGTASKPTGLLLVETRDATSDPRVRCPAALQSRAPEVGFHRQASRVSSLTL
ncbi:unnamed protein product [Symbiodinium sp. CCMP2592]|nr:unnamed protein product [Symbiodinium sp. CCMP2592]